MIGIMQLTYHPSIPVIRSKRESYYSLFLPGANYDTSNMNPG